MKTEVASAIEESAALSMAGTVPFAELVRRLMEAGVERYHQDYTRDERTYYMPDGESKVVPMGHGRLPIAQEFSKEAIVGAIRQSQAGKLPYPEFVKITMAAGCVGYFVQITGRQAIYFGRKGEIHVEVFPGVKK